MLTGEDVMEIRVLWRQGLSLREIARRTGRSRNTVRTHLRSGGSEPAYGPRQPLLDASIKEWPGLQWIAPVCAREAAIVTCLGQAPTTPQHTDAGAEEVLEIYAIHPLDDEARADKKNWRLVFELMGGPPEFKPPH